jgi:hypothetical protein
MVEGLLLDGINVDSAGVAVDHGIELAISVLSHTALPAVPLGDDAAPGTELAFDVVAGMGSVAVEDTGGLSCPMAGPAIQPLLDPHVVHGLAHIGR